MIRIILVIVAIGIFLGSVGCRTIQTYGHFNGMTKGEVRKLCGEPYKISREPSQLKYGADEVWFYRGKSPQDFVDTRCFYFKSDIVVNKEDRGWEAL